MYRFVIPPFDDHVADTWVCHRHDTAGFRGGTVTEKTVTLDSIKEMEDRVIVTLSGNAELSYTPYRLESPLRLVIDIPEAAFDKSEKDIAVGNEHDQQGIQAGYDLGRREDRPS